MRIHCLALAIALASAPARAEPIAAPSGARFPFGIRLVVPRDALRARYFHGGFRPGPRPLNPSTKVRVGEQARDVYAETVLRLFDLAPGREAAELVVSVTSSAIELDRVGWFAAVEHELTLRDVTGATPVEIARWRVRGEGRIVGLGEKAIPAAFRGAAEYAARTFVAELGADAAVARWLSSRGVDGGAAATPIAAPPRLTPRTPLVARARGRELVFADLGGTAVGAEHGALNGALSLRGGWSGRVALLQLALDYWPVTFVANPPPAWGSADATAAAYSLGVDLGVQRRIGSRFEVQAGAGAAVLGARATAAYVPLAAPGTWTESSETSYAVAASAFGAARFNGVLPRTAMRYRVGVEVRRHFGGTVDLPAMGRKLELAELSAGVFVGVELPWGAARGPLAAEAERSEPPPGRQ